MSDFYQTGVISTLHRFPGTKLEKMESELKKFSRLQPVTLLLPCLWSEFEGPAMPRIIEELKQVKYLRQIVLVLGRADHDHFRKAREFMSVITTSVKIVWNDGERIQALYRLLGENNISAGPDGKGRSVWMGMGYILAEEKSYAIALHDCDILAYSRDLLARLCYPVSNPNMSYEFVKGYYARVSDRLNGRVTRLLVTPLVRTLQRMSGHGPFLIFLDSFRYPLAGEFAITTDLARIVRIPSDWGLEVGMLSEVFRACAPRRICEVDICDNYDHKHQDLSGENPEIGLNRMVIDIAKNLFRTLASEGVVISDGFFKSVKAAYIREAQDAIRKYNDDSAINGLQFDRHAEGLAVETFARAIDIAAKAVIEDPLGTPLIPNWNRVTSAIPDFFEKLKAAVDEENA
ncbi:MAG: glycosyl transferase [Planctomycetes bacterium RBG_16_59_8]|nr:MAG: glycosyl transferase [Planctomycetes bacterium RBG_16_59_8]